MITLSSMSIRFSLLLFVWQIKKFPLFFSYDNNNKWALCPNGYYLNGLELNKGPPAYLNNIARGQCCHPKNHPNSYESCYDEDVAISFDNIGWSTCTKEGYYMTGFFKSTCNYLYCIETFKCCKMKKGSVIPLYFLMYLNHNLPYDFVRIATIVAINVLQLLMFWKLRK